MLDMLDLIKNSVGYIRMDSPIGGIIILTTTDAVDRLIYDDGSFKAPTQLRKTPIGQDAIKQLQGYFAGKLLTFNLKLTPAPTVFQKKVRIALCRIKYGKTVSYKDVANDIDNCAIAVGSACRRNPIPIIVPCHRVIASDNSLHGYYKSRGDWMLNKKRHLLKTEGCPLAD